MKFEKLRESLNENEKRKLDSIFDGFFSKYKRTIKSNIERERKHSILINFLFFCFHPELEISKKLGYTFLRVEPFFGHLSSEKDFDVLIYNNKNFITILVEVKSSISDPKGEVNDIVEKIKYLKKKRLVEIIGGKINKIEYACFTPADIIDMIINESKKENLICWLCEMLNNYIKLKGKNCHSDNKLTGILKDGYTLEYDSTFIEFTPRSHPCRILKSIGMHMHRQIKDGIITGIEIYEIVKSILNRMGIVEDDAIKKFVIKLIGKFKKYGVLEDENPQLKGFAKKFKILIPYSSGDRFGEGIEDAYIDYEAGERGREKAVETFVKEKEKKQPSIKKFLSITNLK